MPLRINSGFSYVVLIDCFHGEFTISVRAKLYALNSGNWLNLLSFAALKNKLTFKH
jgi:hypothetical protein